MLAALGLSAVTLGYLGDDALRAYVIAARVSQYPLPPVGRLLLMKYGLSALNVGGIALITWAIFSKRGALPSGT
jgi:hypothetical protein